MKMQTTAVRLYNANDLRIETFELPELKPEEVLIHVITDSLCASTYKAVKQGSAHKRVPEDIAENPIIIGHEMCAEIVEVGSDVTEWKKGEKIVIQPALKLENGHDPGYSYPYIGGNATYAIVPKIVLERDCMIAWNGDCFYKGSLVEAIGCSLRGYKGMYHYDYETYVRTDSIKENGRVAVLGGAGPMGLATAALGIFYGKASEVVITDVNQERLDYAASMLTVEAAAKIGCTLRYVNTAKEALPDYYFSDIFVMAPVPALLTQAEKIAEEDGCINFFAGPAVHELQGSLNLYRIHYDGIHLLGTAGSIPEDTRDTLHLIEEDTIDPSILVSHILGMRAVPDAIMAMEHPDGLKKVCYNDLDIPLVALTDFEKLGETDPMYAELHKIVKANNGLWCKEAEDYLLAHAPRL